MLWMSVEESCVDLLECCDIMLVVRRFGTAHTAGQNTNESVEFLFVVRLPLMRCGLIDVLFGLASVYSCSVMVVMDCLVSLALIL